MIAPFITVSGNATHTPDLAFVGSKLFGSAGKNIASIDTLTAKVSPLGPEIVGGGMGLVSPGPDTLLITLENALITVNTATFAKIAGPKLSRNPGMNALTYVGGLLYGAESTTTAPTSTLVTINPVNGAVAVMGHLPNNTDAIAGIPSQTRQMELLAPSMQSESPLLRVSSQLPPTFERMLRVATHAVRLRELLAYGRDVERGGVSRRIVPLTALAQFGLGQRIVLISGSGDMRVVALQAPAMALAASPQHGLKLIDLQDGFQKIFGDIVEIRTAPP